MESNKSKEGRKGSNRRRGGRKEEKRELRRSKSSKSEENASSWTFSSVAESNVDIMELETSLDMENFDDHGSEKLKSSLMCPALRRQLQTHKNVLRLLHEYKLTSTQINGQRILSIQPMRWSGPTPGIDCEIFVGRIPKTIYEDTLYPLFKTVGEVFQIRLMVDMAELTRGYCFIMYTNPEDAARAIVQLDQYEISPGRKIRVLASVNKCKLYVGPLPYNIASEEVVRVIYASAWDIEYVSTYRFPSHDAAYAIVSFKSHRNAALARRKLRPERLFKCNDVHVEWARVDWNPTDVYEDRGTVNDKGDVQITRKYLQSSSKKTMSIPPTQNDSIRGRRKSITPICPPNGGNGQAGPSPVARPATSCGNATRYSTMLAMSAMDESVPLGEDKKRQVLTDINDNVQYPLDGGERYYSSDKTQRKKDAGSFLNFDMWGCYLPSTLPNSPTSSDGPMAAHDSLDKLSSRWSWNNDRENLPPPSPLRSSLFDGYPSESGVSNCRPALLSTSRTVDQTRPYAAVRYPNHPACYVLLQSPAYLCAKDALPETASVISGNNHARDGYACRAYEQIDGRGSIAADLSPAVDYDSWRRGILTTGNAPVNGDALSRAATMPSYVHSMNYTPICMPAEHATCLGEKRPRPILKQDTARAPL